MSKNGLKIICGGQFKKYSRRCSAHVQNKRKARQTGPPGTPSRPPWHSAFRGGVLRRVRAGGGRSLETPRVNDDRRRHSARQRRSTPTLGTDARRRHSAPTLGSDTRRRHSAPTLGTRIHHECTLSPIAPPECTHQSALWRMHSGRPKGEAQSAVTRAWRPSHREQYRNRHTRARRRIVGCTDRLDENVKTAL